jgi:hypothetical protein
VSHDSNQIKRRMVNQLYLGIGRKRLLS